MSFRAALHNKDFVVMAELALTPDSNRESLLAEAQSVGDVIDGFLLTDNQYGQPHVSPSSAASILLSGGYSPVLQLSCRNRNRVALLGEILGARALGVDSLMLVRGTRVPDGFKPRPKAVMDVDAKELIATARTVNEDEKLGSTHHFLLGTSATVHDPTPNRHPEELLAKADAGAQMIITQLCLDLPLIERYVGFLVAKQLVRRLNVIISIAVPTTADLALWLRENRRSAVVPESLVDTLAAAADPRETGIRAAADLLRGIRRIPGVSGVNFVAAGDLDAVASVLERAPAAERA